MENGLFWLSAVMTLGVFALTWVMRAFHANRGVESPQVASLPKEP